MAASAAIFSAASPTSPMSFHVPNRYRLRIHPAIGSTDADGNNGFFIVPFESFELRIQASDGLGWEHVSVSLGSRCPNWKEMCFVKDLFWDEEDCVVQFHPPKSEYVNCHPFCLHLWRSIDQPFPVPQKGMVG
jgi:hypothetical protein